MAEETTNLNQQTNPEENSNSNQNTAENNQQPKTFTQEEVNTFLAGEKRSARVSVLKALGFDVSDDTKYADLIKQAKGVLDSQKTQAQLDAEAKAAAETAAAEATSKLAALQLKFDALSQGVKPESVDDVVALITPHITEDKPAEQLLKEYKTKYPMFYTDGSSDNGTGSNVSTSRKTNPNSEGLGARLGKTNVTPSKKSSYFTR